MVRVNIPLDPSKTGREAITLEQNLRKMIVGQDEAIQQIVNIYQMHLTGMSAPGRAAVFPNSSMLARYDANGGCAEGNH